MSDIKRFMPDINNAWSSMIDKWVEEGKNGQVSNV